MLEFGGYDSCLLWSWHELDNCLCLDICWWWQQRKCDSDNEDTWGLRRSDSQEPRSHATSQASHWSFINWFLLLNTEADTMYRIAILIWYWVSSIHKLSPSSLPLHCTLIMSGCLKEHVFWQIILHSRISCWRLEQDWWLTLTGGTQTLSALIDRVTSSPPRSHQNNSNGSNIRSDIDFHDQFPNQHGSRNFLNQCLLRNSQFSVSLISYIDGLRYSGRG